MKEHAMAVLIYCHSYIHLAADLQNIDSSQLSAGC